MLSKYLLIYEISITHKRDLMREVRRVNPAGVNTAPSIFWDVEGALKSTKIDNDDVKQQMVIVENTVNYNIKRYNDLKVCVSCNKIFLYLLSKKYTSFYKYD